MNKEISFEQMYTLISSKIFLPKSIVFRQELEKLYHTMSGQYLPTSFSLAEAIKRIYDNGHQDILKRILIAICERGIREFEAQVETYPTLKNEIRKRIDDLNQFISLLKDC